MDNEKKTREPEGSFKDIYDKLPTKSPKEIFIKRIAGVTLRAESTVRMWLSGRQMPDALCQQQIERELKRPSNMLFPKLKED